MSEQPAGYGSGRRRRAPGRPRRLNAPRPAAATAAAPPKDVTGKISVGEGPVIPLIVIGTGMYLAWFGVHYWRTDVRWPTDPLKAVLQGKPLPGAAKGTASADQQAVLTAAKAAAVVPLGSQSAAANAVTANSASGVTPGTGQPAANVNTGKLLAAGYGWGPGSTDWPYLYSGWMEESGWRTDAAYDHSDPYNHAYGIPQANPGTKMASAGADWKTSAQTQIKWGLAYIKGTYGAPSRVPGWSPNGPLPGYVGY